jgi:hypothetical protein
MSDTCECGSAHAARRTMTEPPAPTTIADVKMTVAYAHLLSAQNSELAFKVFRQEKQIAALEADREASGRDIAMLMGIRDRLMAAYDKQEAQIAAMTTDLTTLVPASTWKITRARRFAILDACKRNPHCGVLNDMLAEAQESEPTNNE